MDLEQHRHRDPDPEAEQRRDRGHDVGSVGASAAANVPEVLVVDLVHDRGPSQLRHHPAPGTLVGHAPLPLSADLTLLERELDGRAHEPLRVSFSDKFPPDHVTARLVLEGRQDALLEGLDWMHGSL